MSLMVDDIYAQTIKMFGSHPEPAFENAAQLKAVWGREWGCDTDVGKLKTVLVHRPGSEFDVIDKTKRIESIGSYGDLEEGWYFQSDTIPDLSAMQVDHDGLVQTLKDEGVEVIMLEGEISGRFKSCYIRDSSIAVKGGAIVSRLAAKMRRGEELCVTRTLARYGVPILHTIHGTGMLEGGSFAWLNSSTAVVGRSIRVNNAGIEQLENTLKHQGVELIVTDLCGYNIHIDQSFLMIDVNLALVDAGNLAYDFLQQLKRLNIDSVEITPEDDPWIINGLAVAPGRVLMPPGMSARTLAELERRNIEIIEIPYDSMQKNGGGIHCSTCPLIREAVD
ncbi:MAG: arginine deiminase family protein [Gammaproteobacteria bacterium]|nr:arginine deiminase family protein [Gammaproteobacteria bacterium]MDE0512645.1 arginine deiminase family protein [Gammaproteobacteria bacterium]